MQPFELFAIRYATNGPRTLAQNTIGGDPHGRSRGASSRHRMTLTPNADEEVSTTVISAATME